MPAWRALVATLYCTPDWEERHNAARERRLRMQGAAHHQGNRTLSEYMGTWVREFISSYFINYSISIISNDLSVFCLFRSRWHIQASLWAASRDGLWPTRARRRPPSTSTQKILPSRTPIRLSTAASVSTRQWQGMYMGQSGIQTPRTLMASLR
jgi:hypothetical protein